jgi:hypothetical protein
MQTLHDIIIVLVTRRYLEDIRLIAVSLPPHPTFLILGVMTTICFEIFLLSPSSLFNPLAPLFFFVMVPPVKLWCDYI